MQKIDLPSPSFPKIVYRGCEYTFRWGKYVNRHQGRWRALHRKMWEDAYGDIPKSQVIRMIDGDPHHIALDNMKLMGRLEMLNAIAHSPRNKDHFKDPFYRARLSVNMQIRQKNKPKKPLSCTFCNKNFKSSAHNAKYCSTRCYNKHRRKVFKKMKEMGIERKPLNDRLVS